jgi:squalene synthase HpnC
MTQDAAALQSGKGHRDENFPVASFLIHPRYRDTILAFYRFARAADDVADNATANADVKLILLDEMRRTLRGEADTAAEAGRLRAIIAKRGLDAQHGLDLLDAFSLDVTKLRYRDWDDLMDYCRLSAMPVGRFVLDVHGESRATWPASDALCAALQVINHLQDCGEDYRNLDRVYIPLDRFAAAGIGVEALDAPRSSEALRAVIVRLAKETSTLLAQAKPFAGQIRDRSPKTSSAG